MAEDNESKINISRIIRKLSKEKLVELINETNCTTDILKKLNLSTKGYYVTLLRNTIFENGLMLDL